MIRFKIPTFRNTQSLFAALLISIFMSSCVALSHIDLAQDEFNKASEIENAAILNQAISVAVPPQSSDFHYKKAYDEIKQALEKEAQLKKLEIYVNTMTIKALCEWKLNKYSESKKSAKVTIDYMQSRNITANDIPRDYAVLHSLSALIGIEEMNKLQEDFFKEVEITSEAGKAEYNRIIYKEANLTGNIQKDLEDLHSVSNQISKKHEVQTYLIMSQLAALKVWSEAINSVWSLMIKNGDIEGDNQNWVDTENEVLNEKKATFMDLLATQLEPAEANNHPVYQHWAFVLGFSLAAEDD